MGVLHRLHGDDAPGFRMRDDLCLDTHAMALAYMLLDRIGTLEARVCALQAQVIPRLQ